MSRIRLIPEHCADWFGRRIADHIPVRGTTCRAAAIPKHFVRARDVGLRFGVACAAAFEEIFLELAKAGCDIVDIAAPALRFDLLILDFCGTGGDLLR